MKMSEQEDNFRLLNSSRFVRLVSSIDALLPRSEELIRKSRTSSE